MSKSKEIIYISILCVLTFVSIVLAINEYFFISIITVAVEIGVTIYAVLSKNKKIELTKESVKSDPKPYVNPNSTQSGRPIGTQTDKKSLPNKPVGVKEKASRPMSSYELRRQDDASHSIISGHMGLMVDEVESKKSFREHSEPSYKKKHEPSSERFESRDSSDRELGSSSHSSSSWDSSGSNSSSNSHSSSSGSSSSHSSSSDNSSSSYSD